MAERAPKKGQVGFEPTVFRRAAGLLHSKVVLKRSLQTQAFDPPRPTGTPPRRGFPRQFPSSEGCRGAAGWVLYSSNTLLIRMQQPCGEPGHNGFSHEGSWSNRTDINWRRGWDSNPRYARGAQRFSRPPRSTAPAPLRYKAKARPPRSTA